jgi:predicted porin
MKMRNATLAAAAMMATSWGAQAQSEVTVYGVLDLSIGETKVPGGVRNRSVDSGRMTTSYVGVRGGEGLGGGLSAVFRLEHFMRADTGNVGRFDGDAFWSRTAIVGLSHTEWGTVTLGRNSTPLFLATVAFNPFGDSFGYSPVLRHYFNSGTTTGDSRWDHSIVYSSPSLAGMRFGAAATTDTNGAGGRNTGLNVGYSGGPFAASLVYQNVEKDSATPVQDTRTWQLSGSYQLSAAKLFAQLGKVDNKTTGNGFDLAGLGASVPVGAGSVLAYWDQIRPATGARRSTLTVAYDHFLSKRTDAYVVAMSDRLSGLSSGHGYSLGLRHRF